MKRIFLMSLFVLFPKNILCMGKYTQDATNLKTNTLLYFANVINKLISVGIFIYYSATYNPLYTNEKPNLIKLIQETNSLNKKGYNGKTPLEESQELKYKKIKKLLRAADAQK